MNRVFPSLPVTTAAIVIWLALTLFPAMAAADRLVLKDGTVLEGTVIKQPNGYWVRSASGESRIVAASEVESLESAAKGTSAGSSLKSASPTITPGVAVPPKANSFESVKLRTQSVDAPAAALALWQKYIESDNPKPTPTELAAAKVEIERWQKLTDDKAERINGKWVGGEERKKIVEKADALSSEASRLLKDNQTLQALKKLEEAAKLYPNSFETNFWLGYVMMIQRKTEPSIKYFDQCLKLRPQQPEALGNRALLHLEKREYEKAVLSMLKAAEGYDSKVMAQNLIGAINRSPPGIHRNSKIAPAIDAARLLAAKYGISQTSADCYQVWLREEEQGKGSGDVKSGLTSSGTGFLITADGLLLTNRHVVDAGKTHMVLFGDGQRRAAEVVVADDEQDLALVRIKPKEAEKLPFVHLAEADSPPDGADCTVMGYPLITTMGASIKTTRGIVSSGSGSRAAGPDVVLDVKVNPGNSGGPVLDRFGNVIGVVTMKSLASATEDSYGLAISAGRVRAFLAKNKISVTAAGGAGESLSTEQIAAKIKPATVCIITTR